MPCPRLYIASVSLTFALGGCGPDPVATSSASASTGDEATASSTVSPTGGTDTGGTDTVAPVTDATSATTSTDATTTDATDTVPVTITDTTSATTGTDGTDTTDTAGTTGPAPVDCGDDVQFADAAFEAYIRDRLEIPVGPISGAAMQTLEFINLDHPHTGDLADLAGIECATGVTNLFVSAQPTLTAGGLAPIAALTQLKGLRLLNLPVSDLSAVSGLVALEELDLYGSDFDDLTPIAGLKALRSLSVDELPVDELPVAGLTKLEVLTANMTQVSDLKPLAGLTALTRLELAGAPVGDLTPLAKLVNMLELDLGGTAISDLKPLAGMKKLADLNISKTKISDLSPLTGLPITLFGGNQCQIVDVAPIASWPTPRNVVLGDNKIVEIGKLLGPAWLVPDDDCGHLFLDGNPLSAQAEKDVSTLCAKTKLEISSPAGICGGTPGCFNP